MHERYRQTTDNRRQTDGRQYIANVNVSSRSLKSDLIRDTAAIVRKTFSEGQDRTNSGVIGTFAQKWFGSDLFRSCRANASQVRDFNVC